MWPVQVRASSWVWEVPGQGSQPHREETALLLKQFILLSKKLTAVYKQHVGDAPGMMDLAMTWLSARKNCLQSEQDRQSKPQSLGCDLPKHFPVPSASVVGAHWFSGHHLGRVQQYARQHDTL